MDLKQAERGLSITDWVMRHSGSKWFVCFGTLLGFIRDNGVVDGDGDIDVGVYYETAQWKTMILGFDKWGYKPVKKIVDNYNVNTNPFYIAFEGPNLPHLCLFLWYKHGNYRYHTFDVNRENKEIPSEYVFKGVPEHLFSDCRQFFLMDSKKQMLMQREVYMPLRYGTLLDLWYPDWKKKRKVTSMSPYVVRMKSCSQWKDEGYVNEQLKKSQEEYNGYISRLT